MPPLRQLLAERMQRMLFSDRPAAFMMPGFVATAFTDNLLFVLSLFEHESIAYTAHYGTLLGAYRLGGVAPWDEDADIYLINDELDDVARRLQVPLGEHGFEVRVHSDSALLIRQRPWLAGQGHIGLSRLPHLLSEDEDPLAMGWDAFLRRSELYPLARHRFYGSYVLGPARPEPLLERLYGHSGSVEVMRRFRAPPLGEASARFWRTARPADGQLDWAAISEHFRRRARALPWHATTFPWWWGNGAYNVGVRRMQALGQRLARPARPIKGGVCSD